MKRYPFLLVLAILISCNTNTKTKQKNSQQQQKSILEKIAEAHGFEHWQNVTSLTYTFNVDRGERHFERSWVWEPKKNSITLITNTDTVSYVRKTPLDSTLIKADRAFINDKYWLLAPFNLIWDKKSFTYTFTPNSTAPISNKSMNKLTIVYKNEGGYTPGDAYDFYFEDDYLIKEWVFREQNSSEPSLITTWQDYKDAGNLKIATNHVNNDGSFKLYFTNITVKTK